CDRGQRCVHSGRHGQGSKTTYFEEDEEVTVPAAGGLERKAAEPQRARLCATNYQRHAPKDNSAQAEACPTAKRSRAAALQKGQRQKPHAQRTSMGHPEKAKPKADSSSRSLVGITMLRSREKPPNLKPRRSALPPRNDTLKRRAWG